MIVDICYSPFFQISVLLELLIVFLHLAALSRLELFFRTYAKGVENKDIES